MKFSEGLPRVDLLSSTPASCFLVVIMETVSCVLASSWRQFIVRHNLYHSHRVNLL